MDPLDLIMLGTCALTYTLFMRLVAITAQRRYKYRTGQHLHWGWACVWGTLWPVLMVVWVIAALVLPFEKRPASLVYEPSEATRAAWRLDQRRIEQEAAIEDWENRAAFWFAEGERAEAEDNQALKWLVAEQLGFLIDTQPNGAQAPKKKAKEAAKPYFAPAPDLRRQAAQVLSEPVSWPALRSKFDEKVRKAPTHYERRSGSVGFCNLCHKYRDHQFLAMEGICRECSDEQGLG